MMKQFPERPLNFTERSDTDARRPCGARDRVLLEDSAVADLGQLFGMTSNQGNNESRIP